MHNLANPRDLMRYTLSGGSGWYVGAPAFRASGDYVANSTILNLPRMTVAIEYTQRVALSGIVGLSGFADGSVGAGTADKQLTTNTTSPQFSIYDGGTKTTPAGSATIDIGNRGVVVGSCDGTTVKCFLNGILMGSIAGGNSFSSYGVAPTVFCGGGGIQNQMDVHMYAIWARALTTDEVIAISRNPLAPVWQPSRRVFMNTSAPVGTARAYTYILN